MFLTLKDMERHYHIKSDVALEKELKIRREVVRQFLYEFHINNYIPDWHSLIPLNKFVKEHPEFQEYFYCLLEIYHFCHNTAISNSLLYNFYLMQDKAKIHYKPNDFPFIENIFSTTDSCILSMKDRVYYFQKASEVFKKDLTYYVFHKPLIQHCFQRSYDFAKIHPEYKIVLAYMPYYFKHCIYHAYLQTDSHILDISHNAYFSFDSSYFQEQDIIRILDFEEAQFEFQRLKKEIPNITNHYNPLAALAISNDILRLSKKI